MSSVKSCCHGESAKPNRLPRAVAALGLVALGAGLSLHLYANHVSGWWLPLALLVVAHGAIISAVAWIITQHNRNRHGAPAHRSACCEHHAHGGHSKVIRTPRCYDWLVRVLTLGGENRFRQRTLDLAELQPGESILDVGCGTGTLLIEAAKRVGASGVAHGVEPSSEMVVHANRKAAAQGVTVKVQEGSADRLPYPDASFDVAFCTMVLHHLPPPMQTAAVVETRRVLRPGGRLVILDLDRPKTVSAALSLITLFHRVGSRTTAPDWQNVKRLLYQHGLQLVSEQEMWGGAVRAIVGRRSGKSSAQLI